MRSAARKSASPSPTSAEITPTSVTCGKSCPLAIICVPTSTSISRRVNRLSSSARLPRRRMVSRSIRPMRASGNSVPISDSTRSVPNPMCSRYGAAHERALLRHDARVVAVVAQRAPLAAAGVHGERHAALRAIDGAAALPAEDRGRIPAAIEQNQRLLTAIQPLANRRLQRLGQNDIRAGAGELLPHVHDAHAGQRTIEHAP